MRVQRGLFAGVTCLIGLFGPAGAHGQHPGVVGGESQVSPTVLVTYWVHTGDASSPTIWLLVLWRGRAGWVGPRFVGTSAPFDDTRADLRAARRHLLEAGYQTGNVTLTVSFDPNARTVAILGERHALGDSNVVLVDSVDTRPHVVRTFGVDPALIAERDFSTAQFSQRPGIIDVRKVLERSPELVEFIGVK